MAVRGIRNNESYPWVSKSDPDYNVDIEEARKAGATIFTLGSIKADVRAFIQDGVMGGNFAAMFGGVPGAQNSTFRMNMSSQYLIACRFGIRGWENFLDEHGKPIRFAREKIMFEGKEYEVVVMDAMDYFSIPLMNEIGREIMGANSVTGVEAKNSKPQS